MPRTWTLSSSRASIDKTYFDIKDMKILEHDEMVDKFRDIKSHLKKYKKLQG
jgi:hypothetical protein